MKGRPLSSDEFARLQDHVPEIVGPSAAASWIFLLEGLWLSGLRLGEALNLYWDRIDRLHPLLVDARPMLRIPAEFEKGHTDRLIPLAPDFAEFLRQVPTSEREGAVFNPAAQRTGKRVRADWASKTISRIGRKAGVVVHIHPISGKKKYASAHDLRRSFGERWSRLVMPQVLKELMRHESIDTTLRYYVGSNAALSADQLWNAFQKLQSAESGGD